MIRTAGLAFLSILMPLSVVGQSTIPPHQQMDLAGKNESPQQSGHAKQQASTSQGSSGVTRVYFIAADEVDWDYTPGGRNLTGLPHPEAAEDESAAGIQHRLY